MRGFCLNCGKERELEISSVKKLNKPGEERLEIFSICEICKRKVYTEEIENINKDLALQYKKN